MSLIWWEKTVEYQFVLEVAKENRLFLAPLDGVHERAGDLVFSRNNRWILIEFKKDKASIASEKAKFPHSHYDEIREILSKTDAHHHIVYGQASKGMPQYLQLYSKTYFSELGGERCYLSGLLGSGIEFDVFKIYVSLYTQYKKRTKGSGGGISMDDFALVAGVNTDNKIVECCSLTEFQQQCEMEIEQKQELSQGHDRDRDNGMSL